MAAEKNINLSGVFYPYYLTEHRDVKPHPSFYWYRWTDCDPIAAIPATKWWMLAIDPGLWLWICMGGGIFYWKNKPATLPIPFVQPGRFCNVLAYAYRADWKKTGRSKKNISTLNMDIELWEYALQQPGATEGFPLEKIRWCLKWIIKCSCCFRSTVFRSSMQNAIR